MAMATEAAQADELSRLLKDAEGGAFRPVAAEEQARAEEMFVHLLRGQALPEEFRALGWVAQNIRLRGEPALVLREVPDRREGRGIFVFRQGGGVAAALEAPHGRADRRTGPIAATLLREHPFTAAAWNTLRRQDVDLAHEDTSYMNAFSRAFARVHAEGVLVQLHGFGPESRHGAKLGSLDMVLSAAEKPAPSWLAEYGRCLADAGIEIGRYPDQVGVLGGTTNANARAFRQAGGRKFLHVEMSADLRKKLAGDKDLRGKVARCFVG